MGHLQRAHERGLEVLQGEPRVSDLRTLRQAAVELGITSQAGYVLFWRGASAGRLQTIRPGWAYLTTRAWALDYLFAYTDYEDWSRRQRLWSSVS